MTIARIRASLRIFALLLPLWNCTGVEAGSTPAMGQQEVLATQIGEATFYSRSLQGARTASGRNFDNRKPVAAHRSYPFGSVVRVTNLENGKSTNVTIVDRGPYGKNRREGAIIDLSRAAATQLDMIEDGQTKVRIDVLKWGDGELHKEPKAGK